MYVVKFLKPTGCGHCCQFVGIAARTDVETQALVSKRPDPGVVVAAVVLPAL